MSHRILLVSRGLDAVGTGRELLQTACGMLDAGHDVHLALTTRPASVAAAALAAGVMVHPLSHRPEPSGASIAGVARAVTRLKPQLVASWGWSSARVTGAALRGAGLLHRPKWLALLAGPRRPATAAGRWLASRLLAGCNLVLASTEPTADACQRLGMAPWQIRLSPPGIGEATAPRRSRADIAEQLSLPLENTWTLCVAPLVARSRLERLVWAADQLDVVHRGLTHVLIGHGPLGPHLARRARAQEAASRIRMLSTCELLTDLLPHVRLVWQTGEVAHGGVLVDALSAGVPAVAVTSDAACSIIEDGVTGSLVPADPPSELPRRGLPLIEDHALHARFTTASQARARAVFPLEAALKRQHAAIEELLG
jgi:hypothetical protein